MREATTKIRKGDVVATAISVAVRGSTRGDDLMTATVTGVESSTALRDHAGEISVGNHDSLGGRSCAGE